MASQENLLKVDVSQILTAKLENNVRKVFVSANVNLVSFLQRKLDVSDLAQILILKIVLMLSLYFTILNSVLLPKMVHGLTSPSIAKLVEREILNLLVFLLGCVLEKVNHLKILAALTKTAKLVNIATEEFALINVQMFFVTKTKYVKMENVSKRHQQYLLVQNAKEDIIAKSMSVFQTHRQSHPHAIKFANQVTIVRVVPVFQILQENAKIMEIAVLEKNVNQEYVLINAKTSTALRVNSAPKESAKN